MKIIEAKLNWDELFMGIAALASMRSKDPSTKHGAAIVNPINRRLISMGYSGMPLGDDDNYPWSKDSKERYKTKYPYVIHCEINAILNATRDLNGSTMYVYSERKYLPCNECMKTIIQSGIKEIVLTDIIDTNTIEYDWKPTLHMARVSRIKIRNIGKVNSKNSFLKISKELTDMAKMLD
jgi:dCMP deaminase